MTALVDDHRTSRRTVRMIAAAAILAVAVAAGIFVAARGAVTRSRDGPVDTDFIAIDRSPPQPAAPRPGPDASTGSFESACGRNEDGHINADNMITAAGARSGAQHAHEYVGNLSTNAFSTDASLAAATTTCANGDLSSYSWPILEAIDQARDTTVRLAPASVAVRFRGSPLSKVVAMPRFLRIVTGNAQAHTIGSGPGVPQWSCVGVPGRSTHLYPLCPTGRLLRSYDFPSCWDGRRTDSPDHKQHVIFPAANGLCPPDTFPIPQLHVDVGYVVSPGRSFAIDTAPELRHSPAADHANFVDVMPDRLMDDVVACVNGDRHC